MAQCFPTDKLLEFWHNPANFSAIINAIPMESFLQTSTLTLEDLMPQPTSNQFLDVPEGKIELVTDQELTEHPYCSIGKLFWLEKNGFSSNVHCSTAYYIGNNKLVTVAHTFNEPEFLEALKADKYSLLDAIFVPAMKSKYDIFGENYGHFAIKIPAQEHSSYKFNALEFDIAICHIKEGKKLPTGTPTQDSLDELTQAKESSPEDFEGLFETIQSFDDLGLPPIECVCSDTPPDDGTTWMMVGYGRAPDGGNELDGSDGGKMNRVSGMKLNDHVLSKYFKRIEKDQVVNGIIAMDIVARQGMSGGPWLLRSSNLANGCQGSAIDGHTRRNWVKFFKSRGEDVNADFAYFSVSIRFTKELFEELGIQTFTEF